MTNAIEVNNLRKSSKVKGKSEIVNAVQGVSLSVKRGEIFGFLLYWCKWYMHLRRRSTGRPNTGKDKLHLDRCPDMGTNLQPRSYHRIDDGAIRFSFDVQSVA